MIRYGCDDLMSKGANDGSEKALLYELQALELHLKAHVS
jgi:hypothetical protein